MKDSNITTLATGPWGKLELVAYPSGICLELITDAGQPGGAIVYSESFSNLEKIVARLRAEIG
jgi:hypothetical protein